MAASWKQILQASIRNNEKACRHARYFQVATVRPDGRPANRTVVFRGFLWDTDKLTFVTDSRSRKYNEIESNPYAEIAWYFTESREQYRMLGRVKIIDHTLVEDEKLQRARVAAWKNMSDPGRQQFLWPHPGFPRSDKEEDKQQDDALFKPSPPGKDDPVAESFCLCIVDVEEVDHLELKTNKRRVYKRRSSSAASGDDSCWEEAFVNP